MEEVQIGIFDLIMLPVVAAVIGWVTNYVAVKMLFHPKQKINCFFFDLQGVFPKRQDALATKLGELVSQELLSTGEILHKVKGAIKSPEFIEQISPKLEDFLTQELPKEIPMLAMFMSPDLIATVKNALLKTFNPLLEQLSGLLESKLSSDLDIQQIVEEKVRKFSSDKLEEVLFALMKKEFKFIELVGGVLGFIIGCIQVIFLQI